ncbi:MAG: hypothetical protein WCF84_03160 [Anaerolineae bacterium]
MSSIDTELDLNLVAESLGGLLHRVFGDRELDSAFTSVAVSADKFTKLAETCRNHLVASPLNRNPETGELEREARMEFRVGKFSLSVFPLKTERGQIQKTPAHEECPEKAIDAAAAHRQQ